MAKRPSTGKSRAGTEKQSVRKRTAKAPPGDADAVEPPVEAEPESPDAGKAAKQDARKRAAKAPPKGAAASEPPVEAEPESPDAGEAAVAAAPEPAAPEPAAPEPAGPEDHDDHDDHDDGHHEHEEEHGSSLSRKLLTVLLLLIAGAGIALWGAPKLATKIPSGLEPVARWLTPGLGSARDEIQKLRSDMEARFAEMPAPLGEERIREIAAESADAVTAGLTERIDKLSDQVAAGEAAEFGARLTSVETRLEGLATEIASLGDQLSSFEMGNGEVSAETASTIAGYKATVEGLRAEIESLSARQGELSHRVDSVEAAAARQAEEANATLRAAEREAALKAGLAGVRAGLASGTGFEPALADLARAAGEPMPSALVSAAKEGVPTLQSLLDAFPDAAHAAIRSSINARPAAAHCRGSAPMSNRASPRGR